MSYRNMQELLKNISPDVLVVDEGNESTNLIIQAEPAKQLKVAPSNRKILEDKFLSTWKYLDGRELVREYKFHPDRKWRFDFALPNILVAFEIQGGLYASESGHRSFEGVQRDYEKLNAATLLGWRVFQITSAMMKDPDFMGVLVRFCSAR